MSKFLCFGDHIALYCEESRGYVVSQHSSSFCNEMFVYFQQDRDAPNNILDSQMIKFEVCSQQRYKLNQKFRKLYNGIDVNNLSVNEKTQMTTARLAAEAENMDNEAENNRNAKKRVLYGQIIQLKHRFTNKYVHVNTNVTSKIVKNNMVMSLFEFNSKTAHFRIQPRYKVKSEGEYVQIFDQISLESNHWQNNYWNASPHLQLNNLFYGAELNLGVEQCAFTVIQCHSVSTEENAINNAIMGGDFIRLFHKEIEAYIVAEGLSNNCISHNVHLRIREVDPLDIRSLIYSTSAITYWQIERSNSLLNGDALRWIHKVRFRHATTRQYLMLNESEEVGLTEDVDDVRNLFKLYSLSLSQDVLTHEKLVRIEHVASGKWMHALKDQEYVKRELDVGVESSTTPLLWDGGNFRKLTARTNQCYDDAFMIQKVVNVDVKNLNFITGFVTLLQDFLIEMPNRRLLQTKETFVFCQSLQELADFMWDKNKTKTVKQKQKLLRNFRIIDLLLEILKSNRHVDNNLSKIYAKIYTVFIAYLTGFSRKNCFYIMKHIDSFVTQCRDEGVLSMKAVGLLTLMLRNNRKIVDLFRNEQINFLVNRIKEYQCYQYLEVLESLCLCENIAISNNQTYIAQKLLLENKRGIYVTKCGQRNNLRKDEIYISWNAMEDWILLKDFANDQRPEFNKNAFLYFCKQLDLFNSLCYGQNQYCIRLITQDVGYLTWNEIFICLQSKYLSQEIRIKFCQLLINVFIDIGFNLDFHAKNHEAICVIYENIGTKNIIESIVPKSQKEEKSSPTVLKLKNWISEFLNSSTSMIASQIEQTRFVEQVLFLLCKLIQFGFYGEFGDTLFIIPPLMVLLDGSLDVPFPLEEKKKRISKDTKKKIAHYRETERFEQSPETFAIVKAKMAALNVLDILITYQINECLKEFMNLFKKCDFNKEMAIKFRYKLTFLLEENFDFKSTNVKDEQLHKKMQISLKKVFDSQIVFDLNRLSTILIDLAKYKYDDINQMALNVLRKLFYIKNAVFEKAIRSMLVYTPESCRIHREVFKNTFRLNAIRKSKWTIEQMEFIENKLHELLILCSVPNLPDEPLVNNQKIIICYDFIEFIFDVLKVEQSSHDMDSLVYLENLFRTAVKLLRALTLKQPHVQSIVFNKLDTLLNIRLVESEVALVLLEVFHQNLENCMNISAKQIRQIANLAANFQQKAPEMLSVLKILVKVHNANIVLKRNQDFVMKYVMQSFSRIAYMFEQSLSEREELLLETGNVEHLNYFIKLVDLFVACSECDNAYAQSLCQTILSIEEIFTILKNQNIMNYLKKSFVKFVVFVYMKTSNFGPGIVYLAHDKDLWIYIRCLTEEVITTTRQLRQMSKDVIYQIITTQFLRKEKLNEKDEEYQVHGTVDYIFDAVLPFLQNLVSKHLLHENDKCEEEIFLFKALTKTMTDFFVTLAPVMIDPKQMETTINFLIQMVLVSGFEMTIIEPVISSIGYGKVLKNTLTDIQESNNNYYAAENRINELFQRFCKNCILINNGKNTVKDQLKKKSTRKYTEIVGNEVLPLGADFQYLVNSFISKASGTSINKRFQLINLLIRQLGISAKNSEKKGYSSTIITFQDQTKLDICSMQILRAIIHNQECALPSDWRHHLNKKNVKSILRNITKIQHVFLDFDVFKNVLPHLSKVDHSILKELLCLLNILFFNSDFAVQDKFMQYLKSTQFETVFCIFRNRLQMISIIIGEKKSLQLQKDLQSREAEFWAKNLKSIQILESDVFQRIEKYKLNFDTVNRMKHTEESENAVKQNGELNKKSQGAQYRSTKKENLITESDLKEESESEMNVIKDESCVELVLRLTASFCKNQCLEMQNYLRDQNDNIKSYNIVSDVAHLVEVICANVSENTIGTLIDVFKTLNELCLGNNQNALCVFQSKITDCINLLLSSKFSLQFSQTRRIELCQSIAKLLFSLIEENDAESLHLAKNINSALDKLLLFRVIEECYSLYNEKTIDNNGLKRDAFDVGFQFFIITKRLSDIDPSINQDTKLMENQLKAVRFYEKKCMSVEIVKNKCLQKVYFFVENKNIIRSEVKEKLKWNIDRSTSSSKIRGLIMWSNEILEEINYQRIVTTNPVATFFTKHSLLWNHCVTLLTVLLNVFMLIGLQAPYAYSVSTSSNSSILSPELLDLTNFTWIAEFKELDWGMNVVGIIHNIICLFLLLSFFIANHPSLPDFVGIVRSIVESLSSKKMQNDNTMVTAKSSNVKVFLFSTTTLYYCSLLAFSLAGRWYSYYFFTYPLINIVNTNQLLQNAIKAVTKNGLSLIWISILAIVIMYVYAIIGFAFFRTEFNADTFFFSQTLFRTFFCMVRYGIVGDISQNVFPNPNSNTFEDFSLTVVYNVTFFIIFTTIALNIVFGIIVDTFAELRDNRWNAEEDMKNKCFICSRTAYDFELRGSGFNNHVRNEHNMWAYIYYIIYVKSKSPNNYSSIERYVSKMLKENDWEFFPLNQALCLQVENNNEDDELINGLVSNLEQFVSSEIKAETNKLLLSNSSQNRRWQKKDILSLDEVKIILDKE